MNKKYQTIVLDYDGTLHNNIKIYYPAFKKAYKYLVDLGLQPKKDWQENDVKKFLGMTPVDAWGSFKPEIPKAAIKHVIKMVGDEMTKAIEDGQAELYPNAIETLKYLKDKGYQLIYLSNSKTYYMELNKKLFNLDLYFDRFIVSETYDYLPKKTIFTLNRVYFKEPTLMVGDRIFDIEVGKLNNVDTVACHYGYGEKEEFENATYHINDISELKNIL